MRRLMFRIISQTRVSYRDSALSVGRAGRVHGGDRLPWVEAADNFAPPHTQGIGVHLRVTMFGPVVQGAQLAGGFIAVAGRVQFHCW